MKISLVKDEKVKTMMERMKEIVRKVNNGNKICCPDRLGRLRITEELVDEDIAEVLKPYVKILRYSYNQGRFELHAMSHYFDDEEDLVPLYNMTFGIENDKVKIIEVRRVEC